VIQRLKIPRKSFLTSSQWMLAFVMLAAHTSLTFALKVPGCPTGEFRTRDRFYKNSFSAENFSDKLSSTNLEQISAPKTTGISLS
jgi:hypothetical protein